MRFGQRNTSLKAVEGAPRTATSIRRKTEEQLKLHTGWLQIWESTSALLELQLSTKDGSSCDVTGYDLGSRPRRMAAQVVRSLSISSANGFTLQAVSSLRVEVVPVGQQRTGQSAFGVVR